MFCRPAPNSCTAHTTAGCRDRTCRGLAQALADSSRSLSPLEQEIVRATREDPGRFDELLYEHEETADDYRDQRDRVWLFLALAKRLEEGMSLPHPDADTLSADFGDPSEVEGLVSFMPVASGEQADHHALAEKLLRYIKENAAHYRERDEQRRSED